MIYVVFDTPAVSHLSVCLQHSLPIFCYFPTVFASRAHCWLLFKFMLAVAARSFSAKLLSSWVVPSTYWSKGLLLVQDFKLLLVDTRGFCQPNSPACQGPFQLQHNSVAYQPLLRWKGVIYNHFIICKPDVEQNLSTKTNQRSSMQLHVCGTNFNLSFGMTLKGVLGTLL